MTEQIEEKKYSCYYCTSKISEDEAHKIKQLFETNVEIDYDKHMFFIDALNLINCWGPKDRFLEDGIPVVCKVCYDRTEKEWRKENAK